MGTWLTLAIARGWRDAAHLAQDPDFDGVRQTPDYIACLARLKRAREEDPDPMPRVLAPDSVPGAPSVRLAIAASQVEERSVRLMRILLDPHEFRKRLFAVLDRRMAVLLRYLIENGDAPDAGLAAVARIGTASLYLLEAAEHERELRKAGGECVLSTVEELLRGYPGDPHLPQALLARATALEALGRDSEAISTLRTVRTDHPAVAVRAEIDLCALLPSGDELRQLFQGLKARAEHDEELARHLRERLLRAKLLCDGMPDLLALDALAGEKARMHEGLLAYLFVSCGDPDSERRLREMPMASANLLPVVVCIDEEPAGDVGAWLKEHGRSFPAIPRGAAAVELVWLRDVPAVVVAKRDGTVVAINPDAAELARLATGP
jgi:hypothetical protein